MEMSIWQMLWDAELRCWCFLPWTAAVVCLGKGGPACGKTDGRAVLGGDGWD